MITKTTPGMIAIYGASGHTGRFVVQEARRRQMSVVAVGRDAERLEERVPADVVRRVASVDDPDALRRAFADCALVINCAGPFLDTAAPVAQAALDTGCHYVDVTAEQASARATFDDFDEPARAAGLAVVPAAGFYGGLADLLATALVGEEPVDGITVAVALDRWWPTAGTRRTGQRNQIPRVILDEGRLRPLTPSAVPTVRTFAPPLGTQQMVELPLSEIITMSRHLRVGSIQSLLNRSALDDIHDATTPPPAATDALGRSAQRFEIVVGARRGATLRSAGARGRDIYAVSAPLVVEAAVRMLSPAFDRRGALSLAQALDAADALRALHGTALDVFGDVVAARPLEAGRRVSSEEVRKPRGVSFPGTLWGGICLWP